MTKDIEETKEKLDGIEGVKTPDSYAANYDEFNEEWLSSSALSTFMVCGIRGKFRYIDKIPGQIGIRNTAGSAAHKGREINLHQKVETHVDLDTEEVTDAARDYVNEQFDTYEVKVESEFEGKSKKDAKGISVDFATGFAAKDREIFQPEIQPITVEESVAVKFPGLSRIIVGKIDVVDENGIRDLKTGKRAFGQHKADTSQGLTTYGLLKKAQTGRKPKEYVIDNVVTGKKGINHNSYKTTRSMFDLKKQLMRFAYWMQIIDKGIFGPASHEAWQCSPDWCPYWNMCKCGGMK